MKRVLLLCCFLFLNNNQGECAATLFNPLRQIHTNPIQDCRNSITNLADPYCKNSNTARQPDIIQIEKALFGRSYEKQNISSRLSRIEKSLFSTTYTNANQAQRIDNIISNFNQMKEYPNITKNVLTKMEKQVFNESFPLNNTKRRIERLEEEVFGAVQSGEINSRYEALKMATKSIRNDNNNGNTDPFYSSNSSYTQPKTKWQGLASSINGGMSGYMTGFTPQITPFYNNYRNNCYNYPYRSGYGNQTGYQSNHGYYNGFSDYSSGTGVTILD